MSVITHGIPTFAMCGSSDSFSTIDTCNILTSMFFFKINNHYQKYKFNNINNLKFYLYIRSFRLQDLCRRFFEQVFGR